MLLTRAEQDKIQSFAIECMIKNQQAIRNLLGDPDLELQFIEHMIERKYKEAFELCLAIDGVWLNVEQIQIIINYLDPTINQDMSELSIFGPTESFNFEILNNRLRIKLTKLCNMIYA